MLQYTQDGRNFTSLSEKDVDGLSRPEKKAYYAWKNVQLDQANAALDQSIAQLKEAAIAEDRMIRGTPI